MAEAGNNEREAETVRTLFQLYLERGSVRRVKEGEVEVPCPQ